MWSLPENNATMCNKEHWALLSNLFLGFLISEADLLLNELMKLKWEANVNCKRKYSFKVIYICVIYKKMKNLEWLSFNTLCKPDAAVVRLYLHMEVQVVRMPATQFTFIIEQSQHWSSVQSKPIPVIWSQRKEVELFPWGNLHQRGQGGRRGSSSIFPTNPGVHQPGSAKRYVFTG